MPRARFTPELRKTITRFDIALLLVFALTLVGAISFPGRPIFRLLLFLAAVWVGVRTVRRVIQHVLIPRLVRPMLWRLRNRLLVIYGFIAVVPVVLIAVLGGLMLYGLVGQIALYVETHELERRTSMIINAAQWLAGRDPQKRIAALQQAYPVWANRLQGLEFVIDDGTLFKHPPEAAITPPPREWGDAGGLVIKDGLLYAWAHIVEDQTRVTAMLPLSARFLGSLAPNFGEFSFMRLDEDLSQPARRIRLHRSAARDFEPDSPRNRVPEPEGRFDFEVSWFTAYPAYIWDQPGRVENELLRVRTRPYAVLSQLFAQKVDVAQGVIPAALLTVSIIFLLTEIGAIYVGTSITRTITGAVHDLYEGTERVREGDFSHRIRVKGQDQLASLAISFNSMTANIERLLKVAKENERLQAELEIAKEVQAQLYPRELPELKTLRLLAACNPARMVSGDYYDYHRLDADRLAIAIGDVAGKGISAALLMATVQSALRTQLRHCMESGAAVVSTSMLVSQLNAHLYAHTSPEKYATFCLCIYDVASHVLTYTNAGHLPPVLVRKGEPRLLDVNGIVVGAFPFARYEESRVTLEPDDLLLFYTDGITEAENAYGEQFGEDRLLGLLRKNHARTPGEIVELILGSVREWTNSPELQDDMTLLFAQRIQ